ncbi:hypothetical protein FQR65_LT08746 [Abscondita terminalis]|nr:hypothetical protein FQR65_LT08746 [Abscondita terminalis]
MPRTYTKTKKRGRSSVAKRLRDIREKTLQKCLSDEYVPENSHVPYYDRMCFVNVILFGMVAPGLDVKPWSLACRRGLCYRRNAGINRNCTRYLIALLNRNCFVMYARSKIMEDYICYAIIFSITTAVLILIINIINVNKTLKGSWSVLSLFVLTTSVFVFLTIPSLISIPMFWTYRHLIRCYLKIKYGSEFISLCEGRDAVYSANAKEDSMVMTLFVGEVSADTEPSEVFERLRHVFNAKYMGNREKLQKYHCTMHSFSGYTYMLKNSISIDDCVRKMKTINGKDEITKEELISIINEYQNAKYLKNDGLLWDVIVGVQPVQWKAKEGIKYYPILFRFHHGIGDGFSFSEFIFGVLLDKNFDENISRETYLYKTSDNSSWLTTFDKVVTYLYGTFYMTTLLVVEKMIKDSKPNLLFRPKLNKTSLLCAEVDDGEYFKKIKFIKSSVRGVSFSDIILAAFSYSLDEYCKKHSSTRPKHLQITVTYEKKALHLSQIPVGRLTVDDINLSNNFDLHYFELPVCNDALSHHSPYLQRLKAVNKNIQGLTSSIKNKTINFAPHILLQVFPSPIIRYILNMMDLISIVTILPSPAKATISDGLMYVQNIIGWVPRMNGFGSTFFLGTYGNQLQLSLNIDSALISDKTDAQSILNGIFEYLNCLEKEINDN